MATTPLKTASRALSIATLLVAGFAAWLLGTQGSLPRESAVTSPATGRSVEFAAVAANSPADNQRELTDKTPPRRRLDHELARPKSKPPIDDDSFFDDERPEPHRLADSARKPRSSPTRTPPRIQPEMGRLSSHERAAIAVDELDEFNPDAEPMIDQPRAARTSRPAMVFRPVDVPQDSQAARVDSQLTALQKKIDQLAQAQTEQKSNDLQNANDALQQVLESKQNEKFEKLLQQLKEAQKEGADPTKLPEPKPDTPKANATPDAFTEDKPAED